MYPLNQSFRITENNLLNVLALQHVTKIGDIIAKKLISHGGSAEVVFKEKKHNLLKIEGIGNSIINDVFEPIHFKAAEEELHFIKSNNITCLYFNEEDYPDKLNFEMMARFIIPIRKYKLKAATYYQYYRNQKNNYSRNSFL